MEEKQGFHIKKAAILGAGVMGAQIAGHLVNSGVETYLFDLPGEGDPNAIAKKAIDRLVKLKPAPLAVKEYKSLLKPANYQQHLSKLGECDLVIEAISERLDWKQSLYDQVVPHLKETAILASNTSGISINKLASMLPDSLKSRFCGVHFFNPPRYMHLVELIAAKHTQPALLDRLETFFVSNMGKGVVRAKDTPNFIANRVGVFSTMSAIRHAQAFGLGFDIADALTGTLLGRPKSAIFRTMDVVGLDTMAHVLNSVGKELSDDPWSDYFTSPAWLSGLIEQGALGQKTHCGIYKKEGRTISVLDLETQSYRPANTKVDEKVLDILKNTSLDERFQALREYDHPQAQFLWACHRDLFHYCAYHLIEIANNPRDIDFALRWGYGWQQGPFEIWQQAGIASIATAINQDVADNKAGVDVTLPAWIADVESFYTAEGAYSAQDKCFHPRSDLAVYQRQAFPDSVLGESSPKVDVVYENDGVRLWHQGDDIAILSFKSKLNCVGDEVLDGILASIEIAENQFKGLVLWQADAMNFSVGANLKQFTDVMKTGDVSPITASVEKFQRTAMALRYCQIPTIAGLRGRALGGGCELTMHCDKTVAAFESYIGLVEIGVGLLPAGGGCKEFTRRAAMNINGANNYHEIERYFKNIAMAQVSTSAVDAKQKGYLRQDDVIVMNTHEVLSVAKAQASAMAYSNYRPPMQQAIPVAGRETLARLQMLLANMAAGGFISEHDNHIATCIAQVLCGGDLNEGDLVDEEWFLRMERKAFVELAAETKTQARIQHLLETGKPLRN